MELVLAVDGLPPAKNEAVSMLGPRHPHCDRVLLLLTVARSTLSSTGQDGFGLSPVGIDVCIFAPNHDLPGDATNYLGGIGDVLEDKSRRGQLVHLGDLARVSLFHNDRQIREVRFCVREGASYRYKVRVWTL